MNCAICKRDFKSDDCPHTVTDVDNYLRQYDADARTRSVARQEIIKTLIEFNLIPVDTKIPKLKSSKRSKS